MLQRILSSLLVRWSGSAPTPVVPGASTARGLTCVFFWVTCVFFSGSLVSFLLSGGNSRESRTRGPLVGPMPLPLPIPMHMHMPIHIHVHIHIRIHIHIQIHVHIHIHLFLPRGSFLLSFCPSSLCTFPRCCFSYASVVDTLAAFVVYSVSLPLLGYLVFSSFVSLFPCRFSIYCFVFFAVLLSFLPRPFTSVVHSAVFSCQIIASFKP